MKRIAFLIGSTMAINLNQAPQGDVGDKHIDVLVYDYVKKHVDPVAGGRPEFPPGYVPNASNASNATNATAPAATGALATKKDIS